MGAKVSSITGFDEQGLFLGSFQLTPLPLSNFGSIDTGSRLPYFSQCSVISFQRLLTMSDSHRPFHNFDAGFVFLMLI